MKKWQIVSSITKKSSFVDIEFLIDTLLKNRNITTKQERSMYLNPPMPTSIKPQDVGINSEEISNAIQRIKKAIANNESIVVYADYDADGITAGAIMWETIHALGGKIMPYIPHRVEEGYGLSVKGIDTIIDLYKPNLLITVDHGVTAKDKVEYAKSKNIDVIITDHHVKPQETPHSILVHTTSLCGAGVSWFVAKELLDIFGKNAIESRKRLELATIGTIADMVPLLGANRSIAKYGLTELNTSARVGLNALISSAGLVKGQLGTYDVSHVLAPRLNAMGRLDHALDALRLLCTNHRAKADILAGKLGLTNQERQQLTLDTTSHALQGLAVLIQNQTMKRLLFVSHETYNQGVIGLVAGKLVEEYYRPAIVVAIGETYSKASARSISGFNIVEAIRSCSDILVDVGGHPMAAGFTVETKNLGLLQERLEALATKELDDDKLTRILKIDMDIPFDAVSFELWEKLRDFEPFGFGNPEPLFVSKDVKIVDFRTVGSGNKHLKLRLQSSSYDTKPIDAIAFGMGSLVGELNLTTPINVAYTVDVDTWNGNRKLQVKVKDIHFNQ